jgi:hypothetical protein
VGVEWVSAEACERGIGQWQRCVDEGEGKGVVTREWGKGFWRQSRTEVQH